jgi:hypothetical protein
MIYWDNMPKGFWVMQIEMAAPDDPPDWHRVTGRIDHVRWDEIESLVEAYEFYPSRYGLYIRITQAHAIP